MPTPLSNAVAQIISAVWRLLFKETPSIGMLQHVDRFMFFGAGMIAAKIIAAASQIFIGRTLGPANYGNLTIIVLLSGYFSMPIAGGWGLAFIRIAAVETAPQKTFQALKSLLLVTGFFYIVIGLGLAAFRDPLSEWLKISHRMMNLTISMSLFFAWWTLGKQIPQAFQAWRAYVTVELGGVAIILIAVICLMFTRSMNVFTVCIAYFAGYLLSGARSAGFVLKAFSQKGRLDHAGRILAHGGFLLINGLVGVATFSIDRILIHRALGPVQVGLYQAHFLATFGLISAGMTILLTYAFPIFCRDDQRALHRTVQRISAMQYPVTMLVSIGLGSVVLWLYEYPVSLSLFGCLCLFSAIQFHVQIKTWYLAGRGTDATRRMLGAQVIFLAVNIALLMLLIPYVGILSGGISLLAAACAALIYLIQTEKRLTRNE